jgi:hypothetical protein
VRPDLDASWDQSDTGERTPKDHPQRPGAPDGEQHEADERDAQVAGRLDRTRPDRIVQSGAEQPDDGRIDAPHGGLRCRA